MSHASEQKKIRRTCMNQVCGYVTVREGPSQRFASWSPPLSSALNAQATQQFVVLNMASRGPVTEAVMAAMSKFIVKRVLNAYNVFPD